MKKFLVVLMVLALLTTSVFAKGGSESKKIKIGVSIWSSTDTLGSQCKRIIDEAAKALDVQVMYVDQGHISENVTASAETLCAALTSVKVKLFPSIPSVVASPSSTMTEAN